MYLLYLKIRSSPSPVGKCHTSNSPNLVPAQVGHRYEILSRPTRDYSGQHVFENSNDDKAGDISNDADEAVYLNQNGSSCVRVTRI